METDTKRRLARQRKNRRAKRKWSARVYWLRERMKITDGLLARFKARKEKR